MSKPQTWLWLPQNKEAFCQSQSPQSARYLTLNGTQMTSALTGIARTISLTSDKDLSAVDITCDGILNGKKVSQKIQGPNKNTVETTQIFEILAAVYAADAAQNLSVGTGTKGQTAWFLWDYQRNVAAFSTQVVILDGAAKYSLMGTLSDPALHTDMTKRMFSLGNDWKEQTESKLSPAILFPVRYACVQILESDDKAALEITLLQQGG